MRLIEDFVKEYERQFDFWEAAARTARDVLEVELASSGVRAIVTNRAKSVDRLTEKLHRRNSEKPYKSAEAIRHDIVDLAGVRVALYFPGQMDEVERLIEGTLDVQDVRRFPQKNHSDDPGATVPVELNRGSTNAPTAGPSATVHRQRFSGYGARHFRTYISESQLSSGQERYASALVEVQVASVLMHAWSEVEHDLVYKPLEGELSPSEYALLDQLNGLVLAGEIALEQLQKAGDARVTGAATPFRNHYELAEYLRTRLSARGIDVSDATLGRVDVLFDYLTEQRSATASSVETFIDLLKQDFELRPVAAQLADLMLAGDEARYEAYLRAMSASRHPSNRRRTTVASLEADSRGTLALGEFVTAWVLFENLLQRQGKTDRAKLGSLTALLRKLRALGVISADQHMKLNSMRELRNQVFHGRAEGVAPEHLRDAAAWLREFTQSLNLENDEE